MNNNREARREIAEKAVEKLIEEIKKNPEEAIKLYGHSHGGNVAKEVTRMLKERGYSRIVDKLVFLGTPHREDYKTARGTLKQEGKVINVYDKGDWVQNKGGYGGILDIKYNIFGYKIGLEHGSAKRTIPWATNIEVDLKSRGKVLNRDTGKEVYVLPRKPNGFWVHGNLDSKEVIKAINGRCKPPMKDSCLIVKK